MSGLVDYDSSDSEDGPAEATSQGAADDRSQKAEVLPSFEDALSAVDGSKLSITSAFGKSEGTGGAGVSYSELNDRLKAQAAAEEAQAAARHKKADGEASDVKDGAALERPASSAAVAGTSPQLSGSKRPISTTDPKAKAAASGSSSSSSGPDFKERTKRQRLAGQSGIGEDFRTWRTDDEMTLRQRYD